MLHIVKLITGELHTKEYFPSKHYPHNTVHEFIYSCCELYILNLPISSDGIMTMSIISILICSNDSNFDKPSTCKMLDVSPYKWQHKYFNHRCARTNLAKLIKLLTFAIASYACDHTHKSYFANIYCTIMQTHPKFYTVWD